MSKNTATLHSGTKLIKCILRHFPFEWFWKRKNSYFKLPKPFLKRHILVNWAPTVHNKKNATFLHIPKYTVNTIHYKTPLYLESVVAEVARLLRFKNMLISEKVGLASSSRFQHSSSSSQMSLSQCSGWDSSTWNCTKWIMNKICCSACCRNS